MKLLDLLFQKPNKEGNWLNTQQEYTKRESYEILSIFFLLFKIFFLLFLFVLVCFNWRIITLQYGGGFGTPLQYSCLENPWTEEPGRLQSMGLLRVGHDWATSLSLFSFMSWRRKWQPTPVFLPGESQGRRSLVGCRLWGHTESDTTEVT